MSVRAQSRTNDEVIFKIEIQTKRLPQQIKQFVFPAKAGIHYKLKLN